MCSAVARPMPVLVPVMSVTLVMEPPSLQRAWRRYFSSRNRTAASRLRAHGPQYAVHLRFRSDFLEQGDGIDGGAGAAVPGERRDRQHELVPSFFGAGFGKWLE